MDRILIKHVTGSKANQVQTFTLPLTGEISFGRDPSVQVSFDATREDVVSRVHARITQDAANPLLFTLTDLDSRNGTYVNREKIKGTVRISPGDTIQFGKNGPQIEFDLDPRPLAMPPVTRFVDEQTVPLSATREDLTASLPQVSRPAPGDAEIDAFRPPPGSVGRATVERMIADTKGAHGRSLAKVAIVLGVLIVCIAGFFFYQHMEDRKAAEEALANLKKQEEAEKARQQEEALRLSKEKDQKIQQLQVGMGTQVADEYGGSTVFIEASWKLIQIKTGQQLFHRYGSICLERDRKTKKCVRGGDRRPLYISLGNNIEPYLVTDDHDEQGAFPPIGDRGHSGSGFVVTDNGFILTNKHVAASWESHYWNGELPPLPGYVLVCGDGCTEQSQVSEILPRDEYIGVINKLVQWIPAETSYLGGKPFRGKALEGRNDYLDVTFPKTTVRSRAAIERISDSADVALIKIDVPHSVKPVRLSGDDDVKKGEMVTVLGYPGISPDVVAVNLSYEPQKMRTAARVVPDPSATVGNVQKTIKSEADLVNAASTTYYSTMGDVYQLAINTTGAGNSGGPVFNSKGEVIGIFTYGLSRGATAISFAVPIKHGRNLMSVQQIVK